MNADTVTAISAAIVAVIGAVTALIVAFRPMLTEILTELHKNTKVTEDTHIIVNSAKDAATEQQTRTDNALRAAGIPIPYNPAAAIQVTGTERKTP
jgi:hypothetical protein